jgi:hypothetical protein
MQIQLFYIPVTENTEALAEMNRFLATHKVLEVEQNYTCLFSSVRPKDKRFFQETNDESKKDKK